MKQINDGNNFYLVQNDNITFWGININPFMTTINHKLEKIIIAYNIPLNEVIEISENEDLSLYKIAKNIISNKS